MRRPLLLLALAAALLSALLALELRDGPQDGSVAATRSAAPAVDAMPAVAAAGPAPERTQALVTAILARPLFEQDRRPTAESKAGPVVEGAARLAGIMISPDGRAAIFAPVEGGKPSVVHEGEALGALTVQAIAPGAVTVLSHGKEQVMHPTFAASAATTTPAAPFPVPFQPGIGGLGRLPGVPGGALPPGFTTSFAVPAAPPNLLGPGAAQPAPETRP